MPALFIPALRMPLLKSASDSARKKAVQHDPINHHRRHYRRHIIRGRAGRGSSARGWDVRKHTPEPWFIGRSRITSLNVCCIDSDGNEAIVASPNFNFSNHHEIARRIVACVNACAGIETDRLEQISTLKQDALPIWMAYCEKKMQLEDVTEQRDELLESLEAFSNYIHAEQCSTDGPVHYSDGQLTALAVMARKAIAKAKGGAANHFPDAAKMAPDGWQLVPLAPTIEMISAATRDSVGFGTRAAYQAMLAAAPKLGGE